MSEFSNCCRPRFTLRALFVVVAAVGVGMAVSEIAPTGRTPMIIPWVALCAPSFSMISVLMMIFDLQPGTHMEVVFSLTNGLLYGSYAMLALLPNSKRFLLVALAVHLACIFLAIGLMVLNC